MKEIIEEKYRPLSPWEYFGYSILFNMPVIGFIFLIIFSVKDDNLNRRNYARSFWCIYVLAIIVLAILALLGLLTLPLSVPSVTSNLPQA